MWMVKDSPAEEGYWDAVKRIASESEGKYARSMMALGKEWFMLDTRVAMADGFDKIVEEDDKFIDAGLQKNINYAVKVGQKGGVWQKLEEWAIYGETGVSLFVWKGLSLMAKGMVDVLRLGQGTLHDQSAGGVAKDALRMLSILPLGEMAGVLKTARIRPLAELPAQIAPMECTTNSAVRALWMTRFKFFARVTDLWAEFGQMPPRNPLTKGVYISEVVDAVQAAGGKVTGTGIRQGASLTDVARLAKANPNDVVMFSMEAVARGKAVSHTMLASGIEGSVKFYDTSGQVFRNIDALDAFYADAEPFEAVIVHEARAMAATRAAAGAADALEPAIIANQLLLPVVNRPTAPLVIDQARGIAAREWKAHKQQQRTQEPLELTEYHDDDLVLENDQWVSKRGRYYMYRVKPGDSLATIAQALYGDAALAGRIARYNQSTVGPPPSYAIHPGQQLYIPGA